MRICQALLFALCVCWATPPLTAMGAEKKTEQHVKKAQTQCPVEGGKIDKKVYTDYKGKRIYFCCRSCIDTFKQNPEKYMTRLEKDGIELEKSP